MKVLKIPFLILLAAVSSFAGAVDGSKIVPSNDDLRAALTNDGHVFRQNSGQWDSDIYYRSVNNQSSISYYANRISFAVEQLSEEPFEKALNGEMPVTRAEYLVWDLVFENANNIAPIATTPTGRRINYFGPGSADALKIKEFRTLQYTNLYDGIDVKMYTAADGHLKYDVMVSPGADLASFSMRYDGIEGLQISATGELVIRTKWGDFREARPYSYQIINGVKKEVDVAYRINGNALGYEIKGDWDPTAELVIDPIYLDWSTFFYGEKNPNGTWGWTWILDVDIDDEESVYVTGMCNELFPVKPGAYDTSFDFYTGFVAKMSATGDSLIWFTYIGSSGWEYSTTLTVNELREPVIAGITSKNDFPTTPGAFDTQGKTCSGGWCYQSFVTKFDSTGSSLIFSTFLTGTNASGTWNLDWIRGLQLNSSGEVYVCGNTMASDFPVTAGAFQTKFGGVGSWTAGQDWSVRGDAFLTKFKADGTGLVFSTFIGGAANEAAYDLFINGSGDIYVVGTTSSTNYPTTPAAPIFNTSAQGPADGFVTKFKPDGSGLQYSVMIGGSGYERFEGIYSNGFDEPYIAGYSTSGNFPTTTGAYQKNNNGGADIVVVKMPSSGTNMIYSTYLGGSLDESSWNSPFFNNVKITANVREEAIISGVTKSKDFPVTTDALQKNHKSQSTWGVNTTIAKLSYAGDKLLYGTYFGGSGWEYPGAVKTKRVGCVSFILVGGVTGSADYPTTSGAWKEDPKQWSSGFTYSGYLTKFRDTLYTDPIALALQDTIIECDLVFEVLDAQNQGADIWWSHGPRTRTVIIKDTGTYWVAATYGCDTVRDTVNVQLQYRPKVPVLGNDTTFCDSFPNIVLDAKNDTIMASYQWSTGDTTQTYSPTQPGWYKVTISTPNCGTKSDEVNLWKLNTPDLQVEDSVFCNDVSIVVDAGHANNDTKYRWYSGDTTQTLAISDTGTYYVVLSNLCGVDSTSFRYDMLTTPVAGLPEDSVFCNTVNWLLKQGKKDNDEEYIWTSPDELVSYSLDDSLLINAKGGYKIKISNKCGVSADTVFVGLIKTPGSDLEDTIYHCDQLSQVLEVGMPDNQETYLWSTGETTSSINVSTQGLYTVVISNKCGSAGDSTMLILKESPVLNLPDDSVFCDNISITLDATVADDEATYLWSTGETTPAILVTSTGTYEITLTNRCGNITDQVVIDKIVSPSADLGPDKVFCGEVIPTLYTVGTPGNQELYLWSNNADNEAQTLGEGKHWVQISNKCAVASDTVVLRSSPYPVVDLGPDTVLCGTFSLLLDAGNPGSSYFWEPFGQTTQTINATEQVTYTATVTSDDGCSSSDQFTIGTSCISHYYIPTAFSPNGDGNNDVFRPTLVNYENYSMIIFNRWGEIIYETDSVQDGWDGTFGGAKVMTGIYFYSIRFVETENSSWKTFNGPLRVVR